MSIPFLSSDSKKRDQIIAIDLGTRTTKAVLLHRNGDGFHFTRYAILDAPIFEKSFSATLLSEHLRNVVAALETKCKHITIAIGATDSILRNIELPLLPINEM